MKQKEDLLRESRAKLATMDSVKSQIDTLMKVSIVPVSPSSRYLPLGVVPSRLLSPTRPSRSEPEPKLTIPPPQTATDVRKKVGELVQPLSSAPTAASTAASDSTPVPS